MTTNSTHECGGTILHGGSGEQEHVYCARCHAFRYGPGGTTTVPSGTDAAANRAAWDAGEDASPEADAPLMGVAEVCATLESRGVNAGAFWRNACGGDMAPIARDEFERLVSEVAS